MDSRVMPLLRYSEAHAVYRRARPDELKRWAGSKYLDEVTTNDMVNIPEEDKARDAAAGAAAPEPHPHLRLVEPQEDEPKGALGGS
jgi:hypothetical protein